MYISINRSRCFFNEVSRIFDEMKIWSTFYKLRSHEISTYVYDMRKRLQIEGGEGGRGQGAGMRRNIRWATPACTRRGTRFARRNSSKVPLISHDRYGRRYRLIAPRAISRVGIMAADRMICAFGASDVRKQRYAMPRLRGYVRVEADASSCSRNASSPARSCESRSVITPSGNESW